MRDKEHRLQVSCVKWFSLQYSGQLLYAIPNGGQRNEIVAAKLKAEGVVSGIPDLHVPIANRFYHGLYIELKIKPNKPTTNQEVVMNHLRLSGYKCSVCCSIEEFMEVVNEYMKTV